MVGQDGENQAARGIRAFKGRLAIFRETISDEVFRGQGMQKHQKHDEKSREFDDRALWDDDFFAEE
jgi:hypothetical protein